MKQPVIYLLGTSYVKKHYKECLQCLTPQRRERAMGFADEQEQLVHIAAGFLLNKVLGIVSEEQIYLSEYGKPFLTDKRICFSLSHSGSYAALAVSEENIGIDIEPVSNSDDTMYFAAKKVFSAEEYAWIMETDNQEERFAILWTCKEAVLKADGRGFQCDARATEVFCSPDYNIRHYVFSGHVLAWAVPGTMPAEVEITRWDNF